MKKRKGFNERRYILEYKEFKRKKSVYDIIKKIHEKQKSINNEYDTIFNQRYEKLRHNASTNHHLQSYIANLNFRLYKLPEKGKSFQEEVLKIIQQYTDIISLLEKFQNLKGEKFLMDKKELEDRIMEQSLEEQMKELSSLGRQEKYEKYIYDKLILAQNGLVDICQKYRTEVHKCEKYQQISLKLKSELDICLDTKEKLIEILDKQREIGKKLKNKINKILVLDKENNMLEEQLIFGDNASDKNENDIDNIKSNEKKELKRLKRKYSIKKKRPKTAIKSNKINSNLLYVNNNNNNINGNNNDINNINKELNIIVLKRNSSTNTFISKNKNRNANQERILERKISLRQKSALNKNNSDIATNNITKSKINKNKSMNDINEGVKDDKIIYDRKYLDSITQFLTDSISKVREEIKLKTKLKAEEIRTTYQLKYLLGKCIEDIEMELDNEKKDKNNRNSKYYENILRIYDDKETKEKNNKVFNENIENYENELFVLTFLFDNCFNGINNINSIFPEFR